MKPNAVYYLTIYSLDFKSRYDYQNQIPGNAARGTSVSDLLHNRH